MLLKCKKFILEFILQLLPLRALINLITKTKLIYFALQSAYFKSINHDLELIRIVTKPARRGNAHKALRAMCLGMSLRPK